MTDLALPYKHLQKYFYPLQIFILSILLAPFSYFLKDFPLISLSLPSIFLLTIIINTTRLYHCNGIIINLNNITIFSRRKSIRNENITFRDIHQIIYNNGLNRRDRCLKIISKNKSEIKIPYSDNAQNLAAVLKHLHMNDIKILLNQPDTHLEDYILGYTSKFTNEKQT